MFKKWWWLLLAIASLVGCTPTDSLNPLYSSLKDTLLDESLLGNWVSTDPNDHSVTTFERVGGLKNKVDFYRISLVDGDDKSTYTAYMVEIKGRRFLDVTPDQWEARSDSYVLNFNPAKAGTASVEPHLLRLGMAAYMQFSDAAPNGGGSRLQATLRQAHWFFRVMKDGDAMRFDWMDDEALAKAIHEGQLKIASVPFQEGSIESLALTAETKELQQFVIDHLDDGKVFTQHFELKRRP